MASTRKLSTGTLLATLYRTDLKRLLRARKSWVLLVVQLLPVLFALVYVFVEHIDSLSMFSETVEGVMFPLLIPLAAIFYGGPALVDEMEGRTLTYLTLRPVPKWTLFLGKWAAGTTVACALVLAPFFGLLGVVAIGAGSFGISAASFAQMLAATVLGTAAYTAIFAALGALFARSLFGGILYFVAVEVIFAALPLLELLSVRYHMRNLAGFSSGEEAGMLDQLVLEQPLVFEWWVGAAILALMIAVALTAGASIFSSKQYRV